MSSLTTDGASVSNTVEHLPSLRASRLFLALNVINSLQLYISFTLDDKLYETLTTSNLVPFNIF